MQEKLRGRFARHIAEVSRSLPADRPLEAVQLMERGLEADPLAEELYRELMRLHAKAGRHAEAISVYLRCERTLRSAAGIAASPETQALCHALRQRQPIA